MKRLRSLQQGDLAKWLRVIANAQNAQDEPQAVAEPVPATFVEYLLRLRCIERDTNGVLRITEKGRLALHMERPRLAYRCMTTNQSSALSLHFRCQR